MESIENSQTINQIAQVSLPLLYHATLLKMFESIMNNSRHANKLFLSPSVDIISYTKYRSKYPWKEDMDVGYLLDDWTQYIKFLKECLDYGFDVNLHLKADKYKNQNILKLVYDDANQNTTTYNLTISQLTDIIKTDPMSFYFANVALNELNWRTLCDLYKNFIIPKWFDVFIVTPWINIFPYIKNQDKNQIVLINPLNGQEAFPLYLPFISYEYFTINTRILSNTFENLNKLYNNWTHQDAVKSQINETLDLPLQIKNPIIIDNKNIELNVSFINKMLLARINILSLMKEIEYGLLFSE